MSLFETTFTTVCYPIFLVLKFTNAVLTLRRKGHLIHTFLSCEKTEDRQDYSNKTDGAAALCSDCWRMFVFSFYILATVQLRFVLSKAKCNKYLTGTSNHSYPNKVKIELAFSLPEVNTFVSFCAARKFMIKI